MTKTESKAATEKMNVTYKATPITLSAILQQKLLYRPLCNGITFSKYKQLMIREYRQEKDCFIQENVLYQPMVTTKHKSRPETHFEKGSWETHIIDKSPNQNGRQKHQGKRNRDTTKKIKWQYCIHLSIIIYIQ